MRRQREEKNAAVRTRAGILGLEGSARSSGPAPGGPFLFKTQQKSRSFQTITTKVRAEVCEDA